MPGLIGSEIDYRLVPVWHSKVKHTLQVTTFLSSIGLTLKSAYCTPRTTIFGSNFDHTEPIRASNSVTSGYSFYLRQGEKILFFSGFWAGPGQDEEIERVHRIVMKRCTRMC